MKDIVPGGLIEEHDRRIVDQLEGDGQSFTLTPGETAGTCLRTFQETQSRQDLIHLRHKHNKLQLRTRLSYSPDFKLVLNE